MASSHRPQANYTIQLTSLQAAAAAAHTLQRRTLLLRLPHCWGALGLELPAMVVRWLRVQSGGGACLLVLPSDKPPARSEAVAVEGLLLDMLRDPGSAAARSASWRADMLAALGLSGIQLQAPAILAPFTTLLQGSLQVEVGCGERGRALAGVWNAFVAAHQESVEALHRHAAAQQAEIHELSKRLAERRDFARELEMLEFLKRENARFKSREAELLAKGLLTMQVGGVAFRSGAEFQPPPTPTPRVSAGGPEAEAMVAKLLEGLDAEDTARLLANLNVEAQICGIPMGISAAPFIANLFLGWYEFEFLCQSRIGTLNPTQRAILRRFRLSRRFLDDLLCLNNPWLKHLLYTSQSYEGLRGLYPPALAVPEQSHPHLPPSCVPFLDVLLCSTVHLGRCWIVTQLYDKREQPAFGGVRLSRFVARHSSVNEQCKRNIFVSQFHRLARVITPINPLTSSPGSMSTFVARRHLPHRRLPDYPSPLALFYSPARQHPVVVVMSSVMRSHTAHILGRGMWAATMRAVKDSPPLGARMLTGMDTAEAVEELLCWAPAEQLDVLAALDAPHAARILAAAPAEVRQRLLAGLPPHIAANIVSAMQPPPAAASLADLDPNAAVAILLAMDPSSAAALLQELGAVKAAEALLGMDSLEARQTILESMQPRVAAETAVALLACLSDTSAALVVDALRQEDRDALMRQHRNARPRPKGWLMGLVESIYKEGEALLRKMGRMEALRRQSVPEIVFAHFSNKYGQRSLVDEYAACLANTLALHRSAHEDTSDIPQIHIPVDSAPVPFWACWLGLPGYSCCRRRALRGLPNRECSPAGL
eukprot:XP_001700128.1 predicted protein [Chlamydomonas reinhardtii]